MTIALVLVAMLGLPCLSLRASEINVQDLIAQLGDEEYETRVAAEQRLTE
ncbi:MAG: hypothetical protein IT356_13445, partial [Gemmatimonadaceae bacterium]|nr:hypothetical protein [Gemmatimonadaceae bacterium]